jgi:hypothetical protein
MVGASSRYALPHKYRPGLQDHVPRWLCQWEHNRRQPARTHSLPINRCAQTQTSHTSTLDMTRRKH